MASIDFEALLAESPCGLCLTPMQMELVQAQLLANQGGSFDDLLSGVVSGSLLVRGSMVVVSDEFTRPADTTAYAANDVVGTAAGAIMTFVNAGRIAAGTGYITNVRLIKDENTVTNAFFRLWLYNVAPAAIADNAQFTLLYANRANRLGYVDLVCTTEGTGSDSASALATNVNLKFNCYAGQRDLYGVLEAKQAYTPVSGEKFWVELTVDQN